MKPQVHETIRSDRESNLCPAAEAAASPIRQAMAAAAGFVLSAGWDWLPPLHKLWLSGGLSGNASGADPGVFPAALFIRISSLLVCGMVLDRWLCRGSRFPAESLFPALRLKSGGLLFLAQGMAVLLQAVLSFFPSLHPVPWLFPAFSGMAQALFGLIWFFLLARLPGVWCCVAYGSAMTGGVVLSLLFQTVSPDFLGCLRMVCGLLSLALLPTALPPAEPEAFRRIHLRQCLGGIAGTARLRAFLRGRFPVRLRCAAAAVSVFVLLGTAPLLLDAAAGYPFRADPSASAPSIRYLASADLGECAGVFLASALLVLFPAQIRLVPMSGLALFGCGTLLASVLPASPMDTAAFWSMRAASGGCAAFGLFTLHLLFRRKGRQLFTLACGLALLALCGAQGGWPLRALADAVCNVSIPSAARFMHLLTLGSIVGLFCLYLFGSALERLRRPLPERPAAPGMDEPSALPFDLLTPREREVAKLVRSGMKNLEISAHLNITETTLRVHLRRIYRKLGIHDRDTLRLFNAPDEESRA